MGGRQDNTWHLNSPSPHPLCFGRCPSPIQPILPLSHVTPYTLRKKLSWSDKKGTIFMVVTKYNCQQSCTILDKLWTIQLCGPAYKTCMAKGTIYTLFAYGNFLRYNEQYNFKKYIYIYMFGTTSDLAFYC